MTIVLLLLGLSAVLGFVISLRFKVQVVVVLSALIALVSAITLRATGFGFASGVFIIVACLSACQMSYVLGVYIDARLRALVKNQPSPDPGNDTQGKVEDQEERQDSNPTRAPSAPRE